MKTLALAAFAALNCALPQEEDPAKWVPLLASTKAAERDEAFFRLLQAKEKAIPDLKSSADPRAKDVLALIEGKSEQLLEILGRARDEAGASLDRLLWRSYHICSALCSEREWSVFEPILKRAKCAETGRMRDQGGLKLTYELFSPAWTSKSGAKFDLELEFLVDPVPSVDEPTRLVMRSIDVTLELHGKEKLSNLIGADGISKDTVLGAAVNHPTDPEYTVVTSASFHGVDWHDNGLPLEWESYLWIRLSTADGSKWLERRFERERKEGKLQETQMEQEDSGEEVSPDQGSITRIDPPPTDESWAFDRFKPADCRIAYGPGDFKTLPEDIKGLVLWGEGILQRDVDRISRFPQLTYLEFEGWKSERRVKLEVLAQLPNLETLILHRLSRSGVPALLALKRLKALEIGNAQDLRQEELVRLAELPALTELAIGDSPGMSDGVLRAWRAIKQLRYLKWSGREAAVSNEGLKAMGQLENLEKLAFYHAKALTGDAYEHLVGLKRLRELTIGYAGVDDRAMGALGKIKSLREVWIYGADAVTDEGLMRMGELPNLSFLYVMSKAATEKGWKALRDRLPGRWKDRSAFD